MPKKPKIKIDTELLDQLTQQLVSPYMARIGVLGSQAKTPRADNSLTNADIGFRHEFGVRSEGIPRRSFLRDPLQEKFKSEVAKHKKALTKAMESLDIKNVYTLLGTIAEKVIQKAFETRGFGKWAPNAPLTRRLKGSDSPLVDTSQLRESITSDVKEK